VNELLSEEVRSYISPQTQSGLRSVGFVFLSKAMLVLLVAKQEACQDSRFVCRSLCQKNLGHQAKGWIEPFGRAAPSIEARAAPRSETLHWRGRRSEASEAEHRVRL